MTDRLKHCGPDDFSKHVEHVVTGRAIGAKRNRDGRFLPHLDDAQFLTPKLQSSSRGSAHLHLMSARSDCSASSARRKRDTQDAARRAEGAPGTQDCSSP